VLSTLPMLVAAAGVLGLIVLARRPRRLGLAPGAADPTFWVQVAISAVVLACGFWVLLHHGYSADVQKFASGFIGSVIGFWFKS